jgi:hypothetical protein
MEMADWFSDPANSSQLREILAHPVLRLAMATLLERARPTQGGAIITASQGTSPAALGYYAGYADAIKDLRFGLTNPKKLAESGSKQAMSADLEEAWGYVQSPRQPI